MLSISARLICRTHSIYNSAVRCLCVCNCSHQVNSRHAQRPKGQCEQHGQWANHVNVIVIKGPRTHHLQRSIQATPTSDPDSTSTGSALKPAKRPANAINKITFAAAIAIARGEREHMLAVFTFVSLHLIQRTSRRMVGQTDGLACWTSCEHERKWKVKLIECSRTGCGEALQSAAIKTHFVQSVSGKCTRTYIYVYVQTVLCRDKNWQEC